MNTNHSAVQIKPRFWRIRCNVVSNFCSLIWPNMRKTDDTSKGPIADSAISFLPTELLTCGGNLRSKYEYHQ